MAFAQEADAMPVHDWTRLTAGDFHHFHQGWTVALADALNRGLLPADYMAMVEQVTGRPIPDVVTLQTRPRKDRGGGAALAPSPVSARVVQRFERDPYTQRKNIVTIRHGRGRVVAIVEIVSPGNKQSTGAMRSFLDKASDILAQGVHLLLVDLFPPTPRDPQGVHQALAARYTDEPFDFLEDKPFTVASYFASPRPTAYVETVGLGDPLPAMPIFLEDEDDYVFAPLEETYEATWKNYPAALRELLVEEAGR